MWFGIRYFLKYFQRKGNFSLSLQTGPRCRPATVAECLPWSGSRCVSSAVACHLGDNWPFPTKPLLSPFSSVKCQCSAAFYCQEWTAAPREASVWFDYPQQDVFSDSRKGGNPMTVRWIHFELSTNLIQRFCFNQDSSGRMTQYLSSLFPWNNIYSHRGILNLNSSHLSCCLVRPSSVCLQCGPSLGGWVWPGTGICHCSPAGA